MNKIIKPEKYFTQVSNNILVNKNISLKAKGLYSYLISKPDNYDFSADRIALECQEGSKAIQSALKEIEDKGYLHRVKKNNGKVDYYFFNFPGEKVVFLEQLKNQKSNSQQANKPECHNGLLGTINNTDFKQDFINNTDLKKIEKKENKKEKFDYHLYVHELVEQNKIETDIADLIFDWLQTRKSKNITQRVIDLNLKVLYGKTKQIQIQILENAIKSSWTGLFEPKQFQSYQKPQSDYQERRATLLKKAMDDKFKDAPDADEVFGIYREPTPEFPF